MAGFVFDGSQQGPAFTVRERGGFTQRRKLFLFFMRLSTKNKCCNLSMHEFRPEPPAQQTKSFSKQTATSKTISLMA
jgi:hypothetical protein